MGRSHSEYPFHEQQPTVDVQGSGAKLGNDEDKQKVAQQQQAALPDEGIHYRQPHAQTLQRLKQKREARKAAAQSDTGSARRAAAKKAPAARKAAPAKTAPTKTAPTKTATAKTAPAKTATVKKAPMVKAAPEKAPEKAPAAKKSAGRTETVTAKAPSRGRKMLSRVAAAAKKTVQRVAKKVPLPKALKKR